MIPPTTKAGPVSPRGEAYAWADARDACSPALHWLVSQGPITLADAWARCREPQWLLWMVARMQHGLTWADEKRRYLLLACDFSWRELALERAAEREPDPRSWHAIEVTRAYCDGKASLRDRDVAEAEAQAACNQAWHASGELRRGDIAAAAAAQARAEAASGAAAVAVTYGNPASMVGDAVENVYYCLAITENAPEVWQCHKIREAFQAPGPKTVDSKPEPR